MKTLLAVIVAICLLGVVVTACANPQGTQETAVVIRGDIARTVSVNGNLEMPDRAYLSFRVTGTVTEVLVDKGDKVTKGQILARLDAPSLESSVEVARLQVEIAQEQVKAAQAQYEIVLVNSKEVDPGTWYDKVLRQQLISAMANCETADLNLKIAELNLESAELNLAKSIIVAPFDGLVTDITITEGEEIPAETLVTPALSLVDTSKIEMKGFIDEIDIAVVKPGQEANIILDALPDKEVKGRVTFISQVGTVQAGVVFYDTTVTLENPDEELRDGMSATAEIIVERRYDVLLIPNKAIRGSLEKPTVAVATDGQVEQRQIKLGLSDGINTEVLSGLEEGERVVLPSPGTQSGGLFT